MVEERRFRADLCARLDGLTIRLPPLRERKQEIAYLFAHFLDQHSGGRPPEVEPGLVEQLCLHDWPFNVRELDLLTRRLLVLHGHEPILRRSYLPESILNRVAAERQGGAQVAPERAPPLHGNTPEAHRARRERELALLTQALRAHNGSMARRHLCCPPWGLAWLGSAPAGFGDIEASFPRQRRNQQGRSP